MERDSFGFTAQEYRLMAAAFRQFGDRVPSGYGSVGADGVKGCPAVRVAQARILSGASWRAKLLLFFSPLTPYNCGAQEIFDTVLRMAYHYGELAPSVACLQRAAAMEANVAARKIAVLQEFTAAPVAQGANIPETVAP